MIKILNFSRQANNIIVNIEFDDLDGEVVTTTKSVKAKILLNMSEQEIKDGIVKRVAIVRTNRIEARITTLLQPLIGVDLETQP